MISALTSRVLRRFGTAAAVASLSLLAIGAMPAKADGPSGEQPVKIRIDSKQRTPVRLRFGYGEYVINGQPYHPFNDPVYIEAQRGSGASLLRFPGGTMGNFYDWKNDNFMPDTIKQLSPAAMVPRDHFATEEEYQAMLKKFGGYLSEWGGKAEACRDLRGRYGYSDYVDLSQKIGADISYVGNISLAPGGADPGDYLVEWMRTLKERGTPVKFLELGNEINGPRGASNSQAIPNRLYDLDRYMAVAENVSRRIKAIFPAIKIGILSDDLGNKIGNPCNQIDLQARRISAKYPTDFYDAVVIHPYLRTPDRSTEPPEIRKDRLFATARQVVRNTVGFVRSDFPGKEIWITETGYIAGMLEDENTLTGRMFTAMLETQYFLGYLDNDDVIRAYVKFFAISTAPLTESPTPGDHPAVKSAMFWDNAAHRVVKTPVYYGYALAAGTARDSSARLGTQVESGGGTKFTIPSWVPETDAAGRRVPGKGKTEQVEVQVDYVTARAFLAKDGRTVEVVFINKEAKPKLLDVTIDGQGLAEAKVRLTTVSGELLGKNTLEEPLKIAPVTTELTGDKPVPIPGYSIGVIAIEPAQN